jgi:hypothetical protein
MCSLLSSNFSDSTAFRATIEEANTSAPKFARILEDMIIVTSPDKPLPRAPKGTIIRKEALTIYTEEIEEL